MLMYRILVVFGFLLLLVSDSYSQYIVSSGRDTLKPPEQFLYNNVIGASASSLTGYGIQYQRRLTQDFRLRLVGVYYERATSSDFEYLYNIGVESQYDIFRSNSWTTGYRVYWLVAGRTYKSSLERTDNFSGFPLTRTTYDSDDSYGTGLGFEALISTRFSLHCDFGYALFIHRQFTNGVRTDYERALAPSIGVGVGLAF
jgi:hypothetical protein